MGPPQQCLRLRPLTPAQAAPPPCPALVPTSSSIERAARIIESSQAGIPADAALRDFFARKRPDSAERAAVTHAVFSFFRWLGWLEPREPLSRRIQAALKLDDRFRSDPQFFKPEALDARAIPAWVAEEVQVTPDWLRSLQTAPLLWLRARPGTASELAGQLGACQPVGKVLAPNPTSAVQASALVPDALAFSGSQDLFRTAAFQAGRFEIQDLASQFVGSCCAPAPGETWWDACAGEGGKTLHLADLMMNRGLIWSSDRSSRRLEVLKRRAARAQLFNYRTAAWDGSARRPTRTMFDGILLDAPCSGVGTWQRNPHARWTTTREDVERLSGLQRSLLENVLPALKPGGRLVYAVCTLTRAETSAVSEAFSAAHPELEPVSLALTDGCQPGTALLRPDLWHSNGMFMAAWRKGD